MRRAILVTTEMRQLALFNTAIPQIEAAIRRGSNRSATRRIKALMNELIQQPSEQTVEIFIEMRMRWNFLMDSFQFLENHWQEWATWQDRLEIIWYKFGTDSAESELIHAVYLFFEQINPENCGLGAKEYLRRVIRMVVGFEQDGYPLDSGSPYRLWFAFSFPGGLVDDPVISDGIDSHGLLREAKEELAPIF